MATKDIVRIEREHADDITEMKEKLAATKAIADRAEANSIAVVRMEGTNVEEGRRILAESGLNLISAKDLNTTAQLWRSTFWPVRRFSFGATHKRLNFDVSGI